MTALGYRNEAVQRLRRLARRAEARREAGTFVVEGAKLIDEALRASIGEVLLDAVLLDPAAATPSEQKIAARCADRGARLIELQPGVLARALDTVTPPPIAAMARFVDVPLATAISGERSARDGPDDDRADRDLVVVLVDVRDPGNAGTLLRSAAAAGAGSAIFCAGSADLYNPKTVRASAGSLFHLPAVTGVAACDVLDQLASGGYQCWGTHPREGTVYTEATLGGRTALVLGNEAHGMPTEIIARLDGVLTIPIEQQCESLNVAVAGSVICFEAARQRRGLLAGKRA